MLIGRVCCLHTLNHPPWYLKARPLLGRKQIELRRNSGGPHHGVRPTTPDEWLNFNSNSNLKLLNSNLKLLNSNLKLLSSKVWTSFGNWNSCPSPICGLRPWLTHVHPPWHSVWLPLWKLYGLFSTSQGWTISGWTYPSAYLKFGYDSPLSTLTYDWTVTKLRNYAYTKGYKVTGRVVDLTCGSSPGLSLHVFNTNGTSLVLSQHVFDTHGTSLLLSLQVFNTLTPSWLDGSSPSLESPPWTALNTSGYLTLTLSITEF